MGNEINSNLYPAGGYFFIESDGTNIKGTSWAAVERNVEKYRKNRQLPKGDIHQEVTAQACERNPGLCRQATTEPTKILTPTLKAKVFQWLAEKSREARKEPLDYVSDKEARERAAICRKCPFHKKISHLCSSCSESRGALRGSVLSGRKSVDTALEACDAIGEDLQSSIHLAEPPINMPELPDNCWRKKK